MEGKGIIWRMRYLIFIVALSMKIGQSTGQSGCVVGDKTYEHFEYFDYDYMVCQSQYCYNATITEAGILFCEIGCTHNGEEFLSGTNAEENVVTCKRRLCSAGVVGAEEDTPGCQKGCYDDDGGQHGYWDIWEVNNFTCTQTECVFETMEQDRNIMGCDPGCTDDDGGQHAHGSIWAVNNFTCKQTTCSYGTITKDVDITGCIAGCTDDNGGEHAHGSTWAVNNHTCKQTTCSNGLTTKDVDITGCIVGCTDDDGGQHAHGSAWAVNNFTCKQTTCSDGTITKDVDITGCEAGCTDDDGEEHAHDSTWDIDDFTCKQTTCSDGTITKDVDITGCDVGCTHNEEEFLSGTNAEENILTCKRRVCSAGVVAVESDIPDCIPGCLYNGVIHAQGAVIKNIPEKCMQVVCRESIIVNEQISENCDCCTFNNQIYENRATISGNCITIRCFKGTWKAAYHFIDCCRTCLLRNDPHITVYDLDYLFYENHDTCNYALTQQGENYNYPPSDDNPSFGVYGSFMACSGRASASCVHTLDYKEDDSTYIQADCTNIPYIQLNYGPYITVSTTIQVIANKVMVWYHRGCVYIVGTRGLMIMVCPGSIHIMAHPSLSKELYGLCGYFDYDVSNTFIGRGGDNYGYDKYPNEFIYTWLSAVQTDEECYPLTTPATISPTFAVPVVDGARKRRDTTGMEEVVHRVRRSNAAASLTPEDPADRDACKKVVMQHSKGLTKGSKYANIDTCTLDITMDPNGTLGWLEFAKEFTLLQVFIATHSMSQDEADEMDFNGDDDNDHHHNDDDDHHEDDHHNDDDHEEGKGEKGRIAMKQNAEATDSIACEGDDCKDDHHKLKAEIEQNMTANRTVDDCDEDCHRIREEFRMNQQMIIN